MLKLSPIVGWDIRLLWGGGGGGGENFNSSPL